MTQSDIINNNFSKAFECIKCSNAYSTGSVLSEEKLFKQIREMKLSSFDLSKFTVVGSPTITDDGIASGFSSSDYLTQSIDFSKPFKLKFKIKTPSFISSQLEYFLSTSTEGLVCQYNSSAGCIYIMAGTKIHTTIYSVQTNTEYLIEIEWTGTSYICKINDKQIYSNPETSQILAGDLQIGAYSLSTSSFNGSIDLKQFSITSDGVEVFNCYKTGIDIIDNIEIPYTLSKTGSKIVDVAYRDKVIDLYEQEGQAEYYTIDEENQNFTLPMGEIYGMIEGKADKKSLDSKADKKSLDSKVDISSLVECVAVVQTYQNGNSWYRVYSDGWCEQGGRVSAASQTVTFLKAFANTSYCITGGLIPGTTTASYEHLNIGSLTTTSFYYTCHDSYQLMWKASGYIK